MVLPLSTTIEVKDSPGLVCGGFTTTDCNGQSISKILMYLIYTSYNVKNIPYGQSSAKLPVTRSLGHSIT